MKSRTTPRLRYGATAHSKCTSRPAQFEQVNCCVIAPSNGCEQHWQNGASMRCTLSAQSAQRWMPGSVATRHDAQCGGKQSVPSARKKLRAVFAIPMCEPEP